MGLELQSKSLRGARDARRPGPEACTMPLRGTNLAADDHASQHCRMVFRRYATLIECSSPWVLSEEDDCGRK